jgi:hypothetical protein
MNNEQRDYVEKMLRWIGIDASADDCDICEDGSVYYSLIQVLPKGSIC